MRATCNYAYLYDTVGKMTVDFIQDCACGVGCSLVHLKANEQTINVMPFSYTVIHEVVRCGIVKCKGARLAEGA